MNLHIIKLHTSDTTELDEFRTSDMYISLCAYSPDIFLYVYDTWERIGGEAIRLNLSLENKVLHAVLPSALFKD